MFQFHDRLIQGGERGGGRAGVRAAGHTRVAIPEHGKLEAARQLARGQGTRDDFRPDAGGVSQCDDDAGHGPSIGGSRRPAKPRIHGK